ncbi:MAG: protein translocase subunit SecF [Peptococcaceae bacterium]|nr:protein translocase subunit SecF [Peptococcaceae bacterium]
MMKISVIEKRKIWYIISVVILLAGMVSMLVQGLNLGIDFVGGNKIAVQFEQQVDIADLRTALNENGLEGSKIQELDDGSFMLKTTELNQAEQDSLMADLTSRFGELEIVSSSLVGPSVGAELKKNAVIALALAVLLMIAYISYRFELHFAIAGVIALFHDIFIVVAIFSILQLEVDSTFIAALLTIFGYSINDKIVVFDRIRENMGRVKKDQLSGIVDLSIRQSFTRSMNTSISTLILLLALLFLGGQTTRIFVLAMVIGVIAGTYSSLCIASPIWYEIKMHIKGSRVETK